VSLGLVQQPLTERWLGYCGETYSDGSPCTIQVTAPNAQNVNVTEHSVRVTMTQNGSEWLISEIDPCTLWHDALGSHCD
jgi:hypothetical protein